MEKTWNEAAAALAKRVNRVPGWQADRRDGAGLFAVRHRGEYVASIPATSQLDWPVIRAEAELKRLGCQLSDRGEGAEEMPMVSEQEKVASDAMVVRLRARLEADGGDSTETRKALAVRAVEIIDFRIRQGLDDVEQFGSTGSGRSEPWTVARESLRVMLDHGGNATEKSQARWSAVLDAIEAPVGSGALLDGEMRVPVAQAEEVRSVFEREQPAQIVGPAPEDDTVPEHLVQEDEDGGRIGELEAQLAQTESARADAVAECERLVVAKDDSDKALEAEREANKQLATKAGDAEESVRAHVARQREMGDELEGLRLQVQQGAGTESEVVAGLRKELEKARRSAGALKGNHARQLKEKDDAIAGKDEELREQGLQLAASRERAETMVRRADELQRFADENRAQIAEIREELANAEASLILAVDQQDELDERVETRRDRVVEGLLDDLRANGPRGHTMDIFSSMLGVGQ